MGVIEMIVCDIALFICIFMLGVELLGHRKRLDLINDEVEDWIADILAKIRKRKEKPVDAPYYLGVGVDDGKMLKIPVRDTGQTLVDGEPIRHGRLWTNSEGRIYELPEGCYISGDTPYEMD